MVPPTAVSEAAAPGSAVAVKDPVKDTILTPRFYTTDFDAMAAMDLRPNEAQLEAICSPSGLSFRLPATARTLSRDSGFLRNVAKAATIFRL